ncbi:MAG: TIGR01212 family radical SAM protein [Bacillota bacterium]|nr:TIGR01212 family radical SAM protein [Bacillota bacterium]
MQQIWGDKYYNNLNYFLRQKFGEKVFKISLDGGFSCPNRDGSISSEGCIFCSARGSGDFAGDRYYSITEQFISVKSMMNKKWNHGKYIAYFQAYTNTYDSIDVLRKKYDEAVSQEGVVALAIATRPDCLSDEILNLICEYSNKLYTWIELGLQTINENTALIINRGYKMQVFEDALKRLRTRKINIVVHTIFGLPNETREDMINTVKYLSKKDIQGIKFHLLHLMKDTSLVKIYEKGELQFLTQEQYVDLVCEAICLLPQNIVIHRLTGDAPRKLLIGPLWSLKKWEVLNSINYKLKEKNLYQGLYFYTN